MLGYLFTGLGLPEMALAISRVAVGLFFLLSGYHKPFNAQRHATFVLTLRSAGLRHITVLQWLVPGAEFSGGLAVTIGLLSVPAALGLLIISTGATPAPSQCNVSRYAIRSARSASFFRPA